MARQIGRKWPSTAPRGDYTAQCSFCGSLWRRSQLRRDGMGNLMCPDDDGLDPLSLDQENIALTPPAPIFGQQDAKTEAKVVEVAVPLNAHFGGGGWTY